MLDGKYPVVTGLEHDEAGHPASRPANHVMMVAKRRRKLQVLASRLPKAETYGPTRGQRPAGRLGLLAGSDPRSGRQSACRGRKRQCTEHSVHSTIATRHRRDYGRVQSRFCSGDQRRGTVRLRPIGGPSYEHGSVTTRFVGINKTDGLPFKIREILNGMNERLKKPPEPALATPDVPARKSK